MGFAIYLASSAHKTEKALIKILRLIPERNNPQLKAFFRSFEKSMFGGKYIRGSLLQLGYLLVKEQHSEKILPIAGAYEMLHTSLLAHDDIIDKSILRRGVDSLWRQVGINQALCLGDLGFFLCNTIILDSKFPYTSKVKAASLLSHLISQTVTGQMLDIKLAENHTADEKEILLIHKLKTASYSVSGPLMLGAILAGVSPKKLDVIREFGEYVGIAFQIQDDILGTFGTQKEVGKSTTSDIEENKNTLLITYARTLAQPEQKKILDAYYGKQDISPSEFQDIKEVFEESGSLAYSREKAQEYTQKAKKLIPEITKKKKLQKLLSEFADFIIERQK